MLPVRGPQLRGPFCPGPGRRSEAYTPLLLARPQRQKRLLVWYTDSPHGSAYMEGNLVGLAEDYWATVEALPGYLSALAESPLPVPGARGEHLRVDGVGSFFRSDQSAVSSRCTPP